MRTIVLVIMFLFAPYLIAAPSEYVSGDGRNHKSNAYMHTKEISIRYLAYRDLQPWFDKLHGNRALDYGSGLGYSVEYLLTRGFQIQAVDIDPKMILAAKKSYAIVNFTLVKEDELPFADKSFDLVFSSFVLFEMSNRKKMHTYLKESRRVLKDNGYVIAIIASTHMYDPNYKSELITTDFPQNRKARSGSIVKMRYNEIDLTFSDYYWTEKDYIAAFENAGLQVCDIHYPLGYSSEDYPWADELTRSPLLEILAAKQCN